MWIGFLDFLLLEDTTFSVLLEKKNRGRVLCLEHLCLMRTYRHGTPL